MSLPDPVTVLIEVAGVDVTPVVVWKQTTFTTAASAMPGTCTIVYREPKTPDEASRIVTGLGSLIKLYLNGELSWCGYLFTVDKGYAFGDHPGDRQWTLSGVDLNKIFHNVYQPWTGTDGALTISGGATPSKTSPWLDVEGWAEKKIAWEVDSGGTIDFNVTIDISSQGAYELNNKTATTEDYVTETVIDADTTAVYKYKDATDLDALQRPIRSLRVTIDNDQVAQAITGVNLWVEGLS